tara:strand:+ start:1569 stop:3722 length:2154 start_codon:yes stop_codon:yes gene_type:complete
MSIKDIMRIGIIRYPGSNCDIETLKYFSDLGETFYIWHNEENLQILNDLKLLILPGGFAFGDRIYDNATGEHKISPGTMAVNSPVSKLIIEASKRKIAILGICNGFQILTKLNLLPGELVLNNNEQFICKKVKCRVKYNSKELYTELCIANSYGRYINNDEQGTNNKFQYFLTYENGEVAGVCDYNDKIFGMMPHPERNNYDFKHMLYEMLFEDKSINNQFRFDKALKDLMFSEHISYKTTRKYLKKLHTQEDWVVQGPGENAGIVDIGKSKEGIEYCIAIRIESHNHPTFIDPFEGAATGVGGILRDIFTMGARPIGILDFLRFGIDDNSKRLLTQAIKGISYYGNCVGVPNIGGDLQLHESYNTNPLVNVGCLGLVKKENIILGNALNEDRYLIYVGSKTGNEGINGAAMASATFVDNTITSELKNNIQKSDPFLEKLLLEACCEISEYKLAEGMQDMGAGGLLCASLEVVKRGREKTNKDLGCEIAIDNVPTKYEMEHTNILISESQERMLIVSKKENVDKICEIFKKWDLEHSVIGKTNNTGKYSVKFENELLYTQNMDSFNDVHDYSNLSSEITSTFMSKSKKVKNVELWTVYDSTVGGRTIKGPDKPGSYSILDIYELNKQLILTWGETYEECKYQMDLFEGVKPLCIVNCLNFGDPKQSISDLKNTIKKLTKHCKEDKIPVVGGNVSLYNSTGSSSIRPTPILLMLGITK